SGALWLPLIWLVITCSRGLSQWLNIFGLPVGGAVSVEEGSPLDAWFCFGMIAAGFCVLNKRQVRLSEIVRNYGWLIAFLFYCFFWYLLRIWQTDRSSWRRNELRLIIGFSIAIWWLFSPAHRATSST